jgi:hypothetical protein
MSLSDEEKKDLVSRLGDMSHDELHTRGLTNVRQLDERVA